MIMSGNEAWNRNVFKRWRKVDREEADITLSGRLFKMVGLVTGEAWPPTADSFTNGTSRRLVRAERRERRPGRSETRTSWLRYDGAVPWVALYMSTAVLNGALSWARSQCTASSTPKLWPGPQKAEMGYMTWPRPLGGQLVITRLTKAN